MKKTLCLICAVAMLILAGCTGNSNDTKETSTETTGTMVNVTNPSDDELAGHFKLSDYENKINTVSREENFGPITDIESLLEKTEKLWIETYGTSVTEQKPYQVFYDEEAGAWLVQGTFHNPDGNKKGGVAYLLVEHATGDVLAVWHTK